MEQQLKDCISNKSVIIWGARIVGIGLENAEKRGRNNFSLIQTNHYQQRRTESK